MEGCPICGGTGEVTMGEYDNIWQKQCVCLTEETDGSDSVEQ